METCRKRIRQPNWCINAKFYEREAHPENRVAVDRWVVGYVISFSRRRRFFGISFVYTNDSNRVRKSRMNRADRNRNVSEFLDPHSSLFILVSSRGCKESMDKVAYFASVLIYVYMLSLRNEKKHLNF